MGKCYGEIILSLKNPEIDRIFDYEVPEHLSEGFTTGLRVIVPFGARNTKTEGYVVGISESTEVPLEKIKPILQVLDGSKPMFTWEMLAIAKWMKEKYFCTLSQCIQSIMPAGVKTTSVWQVFLVKDLVQQEWKEREKEVLDLLQKKGGHLLVSELEGELGKNVQNVMKTLREKGAVSFRQKVYNPTFSNQVKMIGMNGESKDLAEVLEKAEKDKRLVGQKKVLDYLADGKEVSLKELKETLSVSDSPVHTLLKKGVLLERSKEQKRDVFDINAYEKTVNFIPTPEQENVLQALHAEMRNQVKRPVLLHGITGSGKTEIYMQMIGEVLRQGKQAIVLVPEISLTPQIVERFISRFGKLVSVTHSRMNHGERFDQWKKARDHEISVMIGPRSALFTPFDNLGIVIIDEEHENSYRSDVTPKYDAREVAVELCRLTKSMLLLGSATPNLLTYHKAMIGEYLLLEMKERTKGSQLPETIITDMRRELEEGNRSVFSRSLYEAVEKNLERKQQTILFLNRRGFSTFVSCRKCGYVMTCEDCNVSYTYHAHDEELVCHYCGKRIKNPKVCPSCGSQYIKYFGTGTQKIEAETKKLFPQAQVLRMDLDTTTGKHSHERILEYFRQGRADILIGTQMIAKGHDFPNVTLVGIMAADLSLNIGSYNASEISFQLITQAAGRAGRDKLPGRVFIQTYLPEHYSIVLAAKQDYKAFYNQEIKIRKLMEYPPFSNIFTILLIGKEEKEVIDIANELGGILRQYNTKDEFEILGPSPANISKIKNDYRWRIIVKAKDEESLKQFVLFCRDKLNERKLRGKVYLNLTMNPLIIV